MTDIKKAPFRADIRLPEALKDRLDDRAKSENRSRNAQAAHYIEMGLDGLDGRRVAKAIVEIDLRLTEILRRLDEMQRQR